MRNYIFTYWQSFDIYDDSDPNNPVLIGTLTRVSDDADQAALFAAAQPSSVVPQDAGGPRWILVDKPAIVFALNSQAPFQNSCNQQFVSPRNPTSIPNWPNNDGNPAGPTYNKHLGDEKHFKEATGMDLSGAGSLFSLINAIATLAATLRAAGKLREAGIAQFAYDRIIDQTFSVTEAIKYLSDNGII